MSRRPRAVLAAPLIALAVLPASAHATDAGLQRTVVRQENLTTPVVVAFAQEAQKYGKDPQATPDALLTRVGTYRHRLQGFKNAVTPVDPQSDRFASAKKQLLTALREADIGLANYRKALKVVQSGDGTRQSVLEDLSTFAKRLNAAGDDEAAALRKLHIHAA